jgi:hypothetical protein
LAAVEGLVSLLEGLLAQTLELEAAAVQWIMLLMVTQAAAVVLEDILMQLFITLQQRTVILLALEAAAAQLGQVATQGALVVQG